MKLYNISVNNLRRRKTKMIFLVIGLLIGIATIVTLLSLTESMTSDIEERLNQFGANIIMTPKTDQLSLNYGGIAVGGVNYRATEFDEADLEQIRAIKNNRNLSLIVPKVIGGVSVGNMDVLMIGAEMKTELLLKNWWMFDGQAPRTPDELLLGAQAAALLHLAPGDSVMINDREVTVAAVLHPTGAADDNIIFADLRVAQALLGKPGKISLIEIAAFCYGCPIDEIVLQLAEKFPEARVSAVKQAVMSKMQSIELFESFSYGVAALVIFIGSLLVFVTMMGSVNERTREIGIFRAIGFRKGHIMQIILTEALAVGLIGGLCGFLTGSALAWGLVPMIIPDGAFVGLNYGLGGVSILLAVALSLLAGLYPAHQATRLDPSEALRVL